MIDKVIHSVTPNLPYVWARRISKSALSLLTAIIAVGLATQATSANDPATIVKSQSALARLLNNSGVTLQWISWAGNDRGLVETRWQGKTVHLEAEQRDRSTGAYVRLNGIVTSIDQNSFTFRGTIEILGTPNAERRCRSDGEWRFAVTQNRKYWRLRQFEWCDDRTDYIDIYF